MSSSTMVTLRDGSKVAQSTFAQTSVNLEAASKENFVALFDLVQKCKNASYKFMPNPFGDSKATLQKYVLINADEKVHDDVRKIVLNSVEGSGASLRLVNPIKKEVAQL